MSAVGNICESWRLFSNVTAFFSRKIKQQLTALPMPPGWIRGTGKSDYGPAIAKYI